MNPRAADAIIEAGLRAAAGVLPLSKIPHATRLALALIDGGPITVEELRPFIGSNWVLGRRSRRIVERYGADVNCISQKTLDAAYMSALVARAQRDGFTIEREEW